MVQLGLVHPHYPRCLSRILAAQSYDIPVTPVVSERKGKNVKMTHLRAIEELLKFLSALANTDD